MLSTNRRPEQGGGIASGPKQRLLPLISPPSCVDSNGRSFESNPFTLRLTSGRWLIRRPRRTAFATQSPACPGTPQFMAETPSPGVCLPVQLERAQELDARQDEVLQRLDELNHQIEALILAWMEREQPRKAA